MKFSIITINRNNSEGLYKTMLSVFEQTYRDFEYIVVDGASTDGSVEVIQRFADVDSRGIKFSWLSEPDTGIFNAMNKGISRAHGEYCLFLNSGDCLVATDTLQNLSDILLKDDIVYGYQYDDIDGELRTEQCIDVAYITFDTLRNTHIPHQSTLIKREALLKLGGYDETYKIISDWAFVMKGLFKYNLTISRIPQYIAIYDTNGISSDKDKSFQWTERKHFLNKEFALFMPDYERWDRLNNTCYMWLIRKIRTYKNYIWKKK